MLRISLISETLLEGPYTMRNLLEKSGQDVETTNHDWLLKLKNYLLKKIIIIMNQRRILEGKEVV